VEDQVGVEDLLQGRPKGRDERIDEVRDVLREIGADELPQIEVWNKIDLIEGAVPRIEAIEAGATHRVWVSAAKGLGMDVLKQAIDAHFARERVHKTLKLDAAQGRLRARLFEAGAVASEQAGDDGWTLEIDAPLGLVEPLFGLPDGDGEFLRRQFG